MSDEKIVSKIRKLLALAKSDNKEEADSAYKKAMELMMIHNIEKVEEKKNYDKSNFLMRVETQEAKFACQILLECFFVKILKRRVFDAEAGRFLTNYRIYGEKTNLEIASYAFDFLQVEMKRLFKNAKKEGAKDKQTFYYGVSIGFVNSFNDRKNYVENKYGLVPVGDPDLLDFLKQEAPLAKNTNPKIRANKKADEFSLGVEAGRDIKLNRGVENKSECEQILLLR